MLLDGGTPSTDWNECSKRREFLLITQYVTERELDKALEKLADGKDKNEQSSDDNTTKSEKVHQWAYCGNWNEKFENNSLHSNDKWSPLKSFHISNSIIHKRKQNDNVSTAATTSNGNQQHDLQNDFLPTAGFIVSYIVRSAVAPVIVTNDGERLQQRNGFKAKVGPAAQ